MGTETNKFNVIERKLHEKAALNEIANEEYRKYERIGQMVGRELQEISADIVKESKPDEYFLSRFNGRESFLEYVWKCLKKPLYSYEFKFVRGDFDKAFQNML